MARRQKIVRFLLQGFLGLTEIGFGVLKDLLAYFYSGGTGRLFLV